MATATYLPNTANSVAYTGDGSDPPSGTEYQDTEFTGGEYTEASGDNEDRVDSTQAPGNLHGFELSFRITQSVPTINSIDITVKCSSDSGDDKQLFVYNDDGASWGAAVDSHNEVGKDTLSYTISADFGDYLDGDGDLRIVETLDNSGPNNYLYYASVVVTHGLAKVRSFVV